MSPLEPHLRRLIERHGPLTVAEYMAIALGDPDHGYYQSRDPFGRGGDFITAPEISQMFGEIVAAWCIDTWQGTGGSEFSLVECGPGRGTLMRDLLRVAARIRPEFVQAATIRLVETSPVLREAQGKLLGQYAPFWHETLDDVPEAPAIFLMNEFLDALPVRQFVRTEAGLCERRVGVDGDRFVFVVEREPRVPIFPFPAMREREGLDPQGWEGEGAPAVPLTLALSPNGGEANQLPVGSIIETCPAALAVVRNVAGRIAAQGGAALIFDYGYVEPGGEDTFQAVRAHGYADPLADPGEADLTAHVDFAAMARAAREAGVAVQGPVGQGEFLLGLGIEHRARTLTQAGDPTAEAALHRLTAPDQMGELFKVLVLRQQN